MGLPGSGKGTQAEKIAKEYGLAHISTGEMFRSAYNEGKELGIKAKRYMDNGELVPDELVISLVKERLQNSDCEKGFILDGYPRTLTQAENLNLLLRELNRELENVIFINVDNAILIDRITGRQVCANCGANYHLIYKPAKKLGTCDKCGRQLIQRVDDTLETVTTRLKINQNQLDPLLNFYGEEIYKIALEYIQAQSDECLFIDDKIEHVSENLN
jgi:adenylate kinase